MCLALGANIFLGNNLTRVKLGFEAQFELTFEVVCLGIFQFSSNRRLCEVESQFLFCFFSPFSNERDTPA